MLKVKADVLRAFGRTNIDEYLPGVQRIIDRALAGLLSLTKVRLVAIV
jgi:hypothetical protein